MMATWFGPTVRTLGEIATVIGVLYALLHPICQKKKEKNNLVYFIYRDIKLIVMIVMSLHVDDLDNDESGDNLFYQSREVLHFSFKIWDEKSQDLAKYDRELFELFEDIVSTARTAKSSAEYWRDAESESEKEMYRKLLIASIQCLPGEIEADMPLLKRKYKLFNNDDSAALRLAQKLYYGACHPIDK